MDQNRRDFLKKAVIMTSAGILAGGASDAFASKDKKSVSISRGGVNKKMTLRYKPFDAKFIHPFGVSGNMRTGTPLILVEIEYDGVIGYGEAAMPPYLGETQASVIEFLKGKSRPVLISI